MKVIHFTLYLSKKNDFQLKLLCLSLSCSTAEGVFMKVTPYFRYKFSLLANNTVQGTNFGEHTKESKLFFAKEWHHAPLTIARGWRDKMRVPAWHWPLHVKLRNSWDQTVRWPVHPKQYQTISLKSHLSFLKIQFLDNFVKNTVWL